MIALHMAKKTDKAKITAGDPRSKTLDCFTAVVDNYLEETLKTSLQS